MLDQVRETLERSSYGVPALPFPILVERLRAQGCAVTEGVLLRRLRAPDSGVRVVDPWRAQFLPLRPYLSARHADRPDGPWVVLMQGGRQGEPEHAGVRMLRRSLRRLTAELDDASLTSLARWVALVEEANRLPWAA